MKHSNANMLDNNEKQSTNEQINDPRSPVKVAPIFGAFSTYRESKSMLAASFRPHSYSVLMGRGKGLAKSTGNLHLGVLVNNELQSFVNAGTRCEKSFVVARVLETVQLACPEGAFVKFDGQNWWEMDDNSAREKIGAMFRDLLHGQYKSSTKSKVAKRRAQHEMEKMPSILSSTDTRRTSLGLVCSSSTAGAKKGGSTAPRDLQNDAISSVEAFAKLERPDAWRKADSPANVNSKTLEHIHSPHQKSFLGGNEETVRGPIPLVPVTSSIDNYVRLKGASDRNSYQGDGVWFNGDSQNLWGAGASIGKAVEMARDRPLEHTTSSNANMESHKQVQAVTVKHDAEDWESMFSSYEESSVGGDDERSLKGAQDAA